MADWMIILFCVVVWLVGSFGIAILWTIFMEDSSPFAYGMIFCGGWILGLVLVLVFLPLIITGNIIRKVLRKK